MSICSSIKGKLKYLSLIAVCTHLSLTSCSSKYSFITPRVIENYDLHFSELGIEPVDYSNLSEHDWWESFYYRLVSLEASGLKHHFQLEHNTDLDMLTKYTETRGEKFYSDEVGVVVYLTLGDNSGPIANVSYFRLLEIKSFCGARSLELLLEKGVEISWKELKRRIAKRHTYAALVENKGIPWILYRFKITKLACDEEGLFNRAFRLSCDRYYCVTGIDGIRRMFLAENGRRYGDLIIPESEGYETVARIFRKAIRTFRQHYNIEK